MDTRFQWQSQELQGIDIYWYGQSGPLVNVLAGQLQHSLSRLELNVTIPPERKPKVFVYADQYDFRGALLYEPGWAGALADPDYNVVLTTVNRSNLDWALNALPHEITHLLVDEAIFGPFGDIPTWLHEGLAQYSETDEISNDDQDTLDAAIAENNLISIRSLAGNFPADSAGALLAYAESSSVVRFLIDNYGWAKIRELLQVFKEGAAYDKALEQVYGFDTDGLEEQWRTTLLK
jgi:hypothetical protein